MSEEIAVELSALQGLWNNASSSQVKSKLPDNDYTVKLVSMGVSKAKKGRVQAVSVYETVDGEYAGKQIYRFDGLDNEVSMSYFKAMCETIGLEFPTNLADLPAAMDAFTDTFNSLINITVKTKGDFTNVYVNGLSEYTA